MFYKIQKIVIDHIACFHCRRLQPLTSAYYLSPLVSYYNTPYVTYIPKLSQVSCRIGGHHAVSCHMSWTQHAQITIAQSVQYTSAMLQACTVHRSTKHLVCISYVIELHRSPQHRAFSMHQLYHRLAQITVAQSVQFISAMLQTCTDHRSTVHSVCISISYATGMQRLP